MSETTWEYTDKRGDLPSRAGEEELRFIRNFHDVFLSIGIALFTAGLAFVSALIVGDSVSINEFSDVKNSGWLFAGVAFLDAAIMWGMAEFFARSRRLFLPAIVILLGFAWFFAAGVLASYVTLFAEGDYQEFEDAADQLKLLPLTVAGLTTLAVFAYYARMKLPFAMGLGGAGVAVTAVAGLFYLDPDQISRLGLLLPLAAGLFLFFLGVAFDARDPARRTRFSDNGFWLHFFAAPLIFGSVSGLVTGGGVFFQSAEGASVAAAATTLGLVLFFAIVSLLINRRALLVAGLLSAAVAIAILVRESGASGAWTAATTLLVLGGAMVLLGGGWHTVRRALVSPFPKEGAIARIIPPEPAPGERDREYGE